MGHSAQAWCAALTAEVEVEAMLFVSPFLL